VDVRLITPLAGLFALTAALPLAIFVARSRRLGEIRRALGLASPTRRSQLPVVLALASVPAMLGLAAMQPVVETTRTVPERTDAQALVAVDVSRSMLARADPNAPTRFDRAREIALGLRTELPEVPFGVVSLTDRVLPHLFPTTDDAVYASTLTHSLDIEKPPPGAFYLTFATNLNGLRAIPEKNYFLPSATKRVLVVLTDGETQALEPDLARAFERRPKVEAVFVHVWGAADERIYETGIAEGGYRPDPGSAAALARAAALVGGRVVPEADAEDVAAAVRELVGTGETVDRQRETGRLALMPYLTALALLPLGFVLLRRNVWLERRRRLQAAAPAHASQAVSGTAVPAEHTV
jgi:von Willebrand factor type A domain